MYQDHDFIQMTPTLSKYVYSYFTNNSLALSPTEMVSNQKSLMVHMQPTRIGYCTISICYHYLVTIIWSFLIQENITLGRDLRNFALSKPCAKLHKSHLRVTIFFLNLILHTSNLRVTIFFLIDTTW